ncbi:hypothetical protein T459_12243 [Capsicum annuum]|uniref:Uncharacterized protein n=1 Tax=Capsicum annuum TaxID=4072 RepID=A0A2G2ZP88_CAPAN|nr:hypothetical protein T459_12243 [Capsicum annuum]
MWMQQWGHMPMEYGLPNVSDHSPMFIKLTRLQQHTRVPFKFFNVWVEHREFLYTVEMRWHSVKNKEPGKNLWLKLKGLQSNLKVLNNQEFRATTQKIEQARADLQHIQESMLHGYTNILQAQEKITLQTLEKWSTIEENIMKQNSRA